MNRMITELDLEELDDRQRKLYETSIFLFKLLLAGIIFQALLFLYPDTYSIQAGFTSIVTVLLKTLGLPASSDGILIFLGDYSFRIVQDCLGWKSMAAFLGLVFASTADLRSHGNFILFGIIALAVGNLVRVVTTIYLSYIDIISFEIIHGLFWKWGLTALVLALWLYWLRKRD